MKNTNIWIDETLYGERYPGMIDMLLEPADTFPIYYQTEYRYLPVKRRWWEKLLRRPVKYTMQPVEVPYMRYQVRNPEDVPESGQACG